MNSDTLFSCLSDASFTGTAPTSISQLVDDSRQVTEGSCFVAVKGISFDGHDAIASAIEAGACAIVAQTTPSPEAVEKGIYWVQVADSRLTNGQLMSQWQGNPSHDLIVLGVTGTNGKTTISYLANHIMRSNWQRAGLIGTIVVDNGEKRRPSQNTTPGCRELQALFADMLNNRCRAVSMEVSSHALDQKRCAGTQFNVGIFTNLTQDHLDYHKDMESYYEAKKQLFLDMIAYGAKKATAVINIDDSYGRRLYAELSPLMRVRSFGLSADADLRAIPNIISLKGSQFELTYQGKSYLVRTPLIGHFNISNSLAAIAGTIAAGVPLRDAIASLSQTPQVPGRMELVSSVNNVQCFVDYAHTPDAVENVCATMRDLCRAGRLITVFGCGGDRDKTKRPLMGEAAARYSDICLVTSDNPRSEDPEAIINDIMPGIPSQKQQRITDRAEAIHAALEMSRPGDVVIVCGKGHEDYQIFAEETVHFSDLGTIKNYYREQNPDGYSRPSRPSRGEGDAPFGDRGERGGDRGDRGGRFERNDRFDRGDRGDRFGGDRGGRFERNDRFDRGDRGDRFGGDRGGRFERNDRFDRDDRFDGDRFGPAPQDDQDPSISPFPEFPEQ